MIEEVIPALERSTLGDSHRYVTFRFRNKTDLAKFAKLINRPELLILDENNRTKNLVWDNKPRIDLESFFE